MRSGDSKIIAHLIIFIGIIFLSIGSYQFINMKVDEPASLLEEKNILDSQTPVTKVGTVSQINEAKSFALNKEIRSKY